MGLNFLYACLVLHVLLYRASRGVSRILVLRFHYLYLLIASALGVLLITPCANMASLNCIPDLYVWNIIAYVYCKIFVQLVYTFFGHVLDRKHRLSMRYISFISAFALRYAHLRLIRYIYFRYGTLVYV